MTSCWCAIASRPYPAQMLAYVQHAVAELRELARYSSSDEMKVEGKKGTSSDIITRMRNGDTAAMEKARQGMDELCGSLDPPRCVLIHLPRVGVLDVPSCGRRDGGVRLVPERQVDRRVRRRHAVVRRPIAAE